MPLADTRLQRTAPLSSNVCRVPAEVGITHIPSVTAPDTLFEILNFLKSNFGRKCQICAMMQARAIVQMIRYSGNNDCSAVSAIRSPRIDCPNCAPLSEDEAENPPTQIYLEMEISGPTLDN